MRKFYSIIIDLIYINIIAKSFCQSTPKNYIIALNYSSDDNLFYTELSVEENGNKIKKKFILDTTFSLLAIHCNNLTYLNNCSEKDECIVNSKLYLNNIIHKEISPIIFNINMQCIINEENYINNKNLNEIYNKIGLNNGNNSFIDVLYNLNIIDEKLFSICFSKNFGYLGLGEIIGFDTYLEKEQEINFIDILPSIDNLFELKIKYIKINNIKIENEYLSFLDTSNAYIYFPKNLYEQIIANLLINNDNLEEDSEYGYCQIIKKIDENNFYDHFHDININFGNYIFIWKSKNYFTEFKTIKEDEIKLCLSFNELNNDNNINDKIIFGTNFMMEHEIIFDKDNQKIAFINVDCNELFFNDNNLEIENNEASNDQGNTSYISEINTDELNTNSQQNNNTNEILISDKSDIINITNFIDFKTNESSSETIKEKYISDYSTNFLDNTYNNEIIINNTIYETTINNKFTGEFIYSEMDTTQVLDEDQGINNTTDLLKNFDTTIITENIQTTLINIPTTIQNIPTTMINIPTTIIKIPTTIIDVPTTIIKIPTTIIKVPTTIIKVPTTIINVPTTIINIPTTNIIENKVGELPYNSNDNNNKETNINTIELNTDKDKLKKENQIQNQNNNNNKFFEIIKSFLKNKLIYFFVAFICIILCFVSIIFLSCAIISCVKYIKKRSSNYMEQVDVELPKYSRDNNMSSFDD